VLTEAHSLSHFTIPIFKELVSYWEN